MVTIYYNDSKDQQTMMKIQKCHEYGLFAVVMDTYSTWGTQQDETLTKTQPLQGAGELISVSELEVNDDHKRALTVIWYMKKYWLI